MKTQEEVNAEWNPMAGKWDDVAIEYSDQFYKILWEETGIDPTDASVIHKEQQSFTILDFGCGTGLLVENLVENIPTANVICVDAAEEMILRVQQKIQARGWNNVQAFCNILSRSESFDATTKEILNALKGKVDLIIASSVMSFVPEADMNKTMEVLSTFLKPGGLFIHSDWPCTDLSPDGFTEDKAKALYKTGKLKLKSTAIRKVQMQGEDAKIFVGVAQAPFIKT
jgi:2-polyprenyl-3-methyl-5-hydroxy-6-metoxy-1,4-benzoquinol methylase